MRILKFFLIASLALANSLACIAQDKGYWTAAGNTANSITGDIALSENKVTINYIAFLMVKARALTAAEVSAAFDIDTSSSGMGALYHVTIPASQRFLKKNTLCGSEVTQWMATYASGKTLQVAFFSGDTPPVFTVDAFAHGTDICGTFTYAR